MKRITKILSLIGITLLSANTLADDINILTVNRMDIATAANSDSARPMVLFLLDTSIVQEVEIIDGGSGCNEEADGAGNHKRLKFHLQSNFPHEQGSVPINIDFDYATGCGDGGSTKTTTWTKNAKEVVQYVMKKRQDIKYGVWKLTDTAAAKVLDLRRYQLAQGSYTAEIDTLEEALAAVDSITVGSINMPLVGGLDSIYTYLHGNESPLNAANECKNLQLVIIANGGWNNDIAYSTTPIGGVASGIDQEAFLKNLATRFNTTGVVKAGCGTVNTSVIGYKPGDSKLIGPLFQGYDPSVENSSVAQSMAANGDGFSYVGSATAIAKAMIGYLDYTYPKATTFTTPSSPIRLNRASHKQEFYATGFAPESETSWKGSISRWETDSAEKRPVVAGELNDNFITSATRANTYTTRGATAGSAVAELAANDDIFAEDITWLQSNIKNTFADPIHFKPLAIDYGGTIGTRMVIGTNQGLLQMFDAGGAEQWALLPKELERLIPALRSGNKAPNYAMMDHFYGIDGAPAVFIYDANKDGKIDSGDDDRVLLYFGLRRGGATTYGLDITDPDSAPKFLWSKGEMNLDYGAYVGVKDDLDKDEDTVGGPSKWGGCPTYAIRTLEAALGFGSSCNSRPGSLGMQTCAHNALLNCTTGRTSGAGKEVIGPIQGASGDGEDIFAIRVEDVHADGCISLATQKQLYCGEDLTGETSATIKANVGAMYHYAWQGGTCSQHDATGGENAETGAAGIAIGEPVNTITSAGIIGFGLNPLPADIYITSAKIRLHHSAASNASVLASTLYGNGISVTAKAGFFGEGYTREPITCGDKDDNGDRQHIAKVKDPVLAGTASNYITMTDNIDVELYPQVMFPYYYTNGSINNQGIYALTQLFRDKVDNATVKSNCRDSEYPTDPVLSYLNEDTTCQAWVQFKLKALSIPDVKRSLITYETPALGPALDPNWEYAPELILTWSYDKPAGYDAVSLTDGQMSGNAGCVEDFDSCQE